MMAFVIDQGNQCYKLVVVLIVGWIRRVDGCQETRPVGYSMQHLQTHISQAVNRQQVFQLSLVGSKVTHHLQGLIFKSLGPELTEPR